MLMGVLSLGISESWKFWPTNSMLPNRRPGAGRGPLTLANYKSLDPGLRRDDGEEHPCIFITF
jgi:hypothetical protein